jgi:hypothetical protein
MDKVVVKEIKEGKRKRNKWTQKISKLGIIANKTTIRIVEKHVRTQFITAWTPTIKEVGDRFHQNFQASLWVNPHRYMGANLGCTIWVH